MSGHGGNPGKFEPCRRFEAGFHNTLIAHPGTKTAAYLHSFIWRIVQRSTHFHPGTTFNSVSRTELTVAPG